MGPPTSTSSHGSGSRRSAEPSSATSGSKGDSEERGALSEREHCRVNSDQNFQQNAISIQILEKVE